VPRLTPEQLGITRRALTLPDLATSSVAPSRVDGYASATDQYRAQGWQSVPVFGKEHPPTGATGKAGTVTDEKRAKWKRDPKWRGANLAIRHEVTIAIDVDNHDGKNGAQQLADWAAEFGPLPQTFTSTSRADTDPQSRQYIFRVPEGTKLISKGENVEICQHDHRYSVVHPSIHPTTGKPYRWYDLDGDVMDGPPALDDVPPLPIAWLVGLAAGTAYSRGAVDPRTTQRRATLGELLSDLPERGDGRMNDWLTGVAGHRAKLHHNDRAAYETAVRDDAALVDPNYEDTEKVLESVWGTEVENHPERDGGVPTASTGFLASINGLLHVQCQVKGEAGPETFTTPWGDFGLESLGEAVEDDGHTAAWLALLRVGDRVHSVMLSPDLLSDDRKVRAFLAGYGASVAEPASAFPRIAPGVRILRFLKAHSPGSARIVPHLGWDEQSRSFVTFSGVIRTDGHHNGGDSDVLVMADPRLLTYGAKFEYGFDADEETARAVLREILTWHDPESIAVFGSWWAATFLKPQTFRRTALFPFMAVEAVSGSAKTTGAFGDLIQLSGSDAGHELSTKAGFRDKLSVNQSGIVWIDDADDLEAYEEWIRASTMRGTVSKKGIDNTTTERFPLVASPMVSGEGLGMRGQKALGDRSVVINPPPVSQRRSLHDPDQLQWPDIQDFRAQHGKFTRYAGWMVRLALANVDGYMAQLVAAQKRYSGRYGDNLAVVTAGAWLLDLMAGTGQWAQNLVADWCAEKDGAYLPDENALTEKVIPWALEKFGLPTWVQGTQAPMVSSFGQDVVPGVMVTRRSPGTLLAEATLWVNTARLAHLWAEHHRSAQERTETEQALQAQVTSVTGPRAEWKQAKFAEDRKQFRPLLPAYTRRILARFAGDDE